MPRKRPMPSEFQAMWLFAMFDLPVKEPEDRREYTRFRTALLHQGFSMLQYSVYARYYASEEATAAQRKFLRGILPPGGEVRLLAVTEHQFGKMEVYREKSRDNAEAPPEQLMFF
jgi:CRISPR-associated protein Cas2